MRERLIELLIEADNTCQSYEAFADNLLANGVIVPPVKVGDTIWVIESKCASGRYRGLCSTYSDYDCDKCSLNDRWGVFDYTVNSQWLWLLTIDNTSRYVCGKTVFLTKEEAERALSERGDAT